MKSFWGIFKARTKEFYRDTSALSWSIIFPILLIVGCAVAFSNKQGTQIKVMYLGNLESTAMLTQAYVQAIAVTDIEFGKKRLQHHQIDMLIDNRLNQNYWINSESNNGKIAEQLLIASSETAISKNTLNGRSIRYVDWVVPGVLGMNMMFGALFGVGYVIVRYRKNGVLKRLQATPVSAFQFIAAQLASRLIILVFFAATVFIGCYFALDLLIIGNPFTLLLIAILGAMNLIAFGLIISTRTASEEFANGLLNVASWPMMFLSEVWFSLDSAPAWLQSVAELLPLSHIVQPARAVLIDGANLIDIRYDLIWLLITSILFMLIASLLFKWHSDN